METRDSHVHRGVDAVHPDPRHVHMCGSTDMHLRIQRCTKTPIRDTQTHTYRHTGHHALGEPFGASTG